MFGSFYHIIDEVPLFTHTSLCDADPRKTQLTVPLYLEISSASGTAMIHLAIFS